MDILFDSFTSCGIFKRYQIIETIQFPRKYYYVIVCPLHYFSKTFYDTYNGIIIRLELQANLSIYYTHYLLFIPTCDTHLLPINKTFIPCYHFVLLWQHFLYFSFLLRYFLSWHFLWSFVTSTLALFLKSLYHCCLYILVCIIYSLCNLSYMQIGKVHFIVSLSLWNYFHLILIFFIISVFFFKAITSK